ncbi:hypothetical protein CO2235_U850027 [Cupriavidus oxalaticus]|uniref:Uncharacterized protein n=1 Tax=Cupriavidus oxalaticus TaxID=96344 RepID=A0A375FNH7_9BURK|nr:hypothetical protein CO2235_U850027 [Cupriavidus oxalaticus]
MRDKQECHAVIQQSFNLLIAALLKERVANCQSLINNENIRRKLNLNRKCQTDQHAAGVRPHRLIDVLANIRERRNCIEAAENFIC